MSVYLNQHNQKLSVNGTCFLLVFIQPLLLLILTLTTNRSGGAGRIGIARIEHQLYRRGFPCIPLLFEPVLSLGVGQSRVGLLSHEANM
ncbi:hypothetical protein SQ11_13395 [Nitrosospira sp. NpAV]|nr:hypothetical protein SQ11_13395 [Nitrosospira sp. NpAV]